MKFPVASIDRDGATLQGSFAEVRPGWAALEASKRAGARRRLGGRSRLGDSVVVVMEGERGVEQPEERVCTYLLLLLGGDGRNLQRCPPPRRAHTAMTYPRNTAQGLLCWWASLHRLTATRSNQAVALRKITRLAKHHLYVCCTKSPSTPAGTTANAPDRRANWPPSCKSSANPRAPERESETTYTVLPPL